ncbi:MAG: ATP-dependent Clp protease ATP-binding subunit, partial [Cyanobium sp.]
SKFEQHHTLSYHDKALEQAAILSDKYVADRYLPDKAIDVLDEAGARVRLENRRLPLGLRSLMKELQETIRDKEECIKEHDFEAAKQLLDHEMEVRTHIRIMKQSALTNQKRGFTRHEVDMVTETDVSDVISNWTGIPVAKITGPESERLLKMEETIHERIIGQKHAVVAVSKAIRRARVGLRNPNRPIASFIFAGPTGVGKTELTKALSDYMFSSEDSMIRLDMSEYMEKHTVAKLIGSPPGYVGYNEGGQLTEAVRSKPYSVVLLDEVEKAHPDVFNLLLQILDDGRLTDSKGRVIDFTNTLIIMTTNLGAKIIERESGIKPKSEQGERGFKITPDAVLGWEPVPEPIKDPEVFDRVTKLVNDELKNFFRPEFLNRIDEIIVFNHLTRIDIWQICGLMIKQVQNRLRDKGINLIVELSVQAFLTDEGYDPIYGARPLRRAIMKYLEDTLAEQCLSKTLYPNTKILVRRKKVEGTLLTYTNELEVEIDFTDVDPQLLQGSTQLTNEPVPVLVDSRANANESNQPGSPSESKESKPKLSGRASRFFNRSKND